MTLAVGRSVYFRMAVNLARSFRWWHPQPDIDFLLVSDLDHRLPADLTSGVRLLRLPPKRVGTGFGAKLHLDEITPAPRTLFLDADCLCVAPLGPLFDRLEGHSFTAIGHESADGEFFGDVASICARFAIRRLPQFVGALYYFERNDVSHAVFSTARNLAAQYDDLGLVRLRNVPNEEPLLAIAMALNGQVPIPDDGSIKADMMHYQSRGRFDVLDTGADLIRRGYAPMHLPERARPCIVHFNCGFSEEALYLREVGRVEKVTVRGWPRPLATIHGHMFHTIPDVVRRALKNLFRPVYHRIIGTRPIRPSARAPVD